jgi:uncharacterized membrane protein
MYISAGAPSDAVVRIGKDIYEKFSIELLNPFSRDLSYVLAEASPDALHWVNRILWYLILLFMAVGATTLVSSLRRKEVGKEYATLAVGNYLLLGVCIAIPFFSNALGVGRMIHVATLVLAPFCILGAEIIFRGFSRAIRFIRRSTVWRTDSRIAVTIILVLFFLFNTSLPFEIAKSAERRSFPLAFGAISKGDTDIDITNLVYLHMASPTEQEVSSAEWLNKFRNEERCVYGTYWEMGVPALVSYGMIPEKQTHNLTPLTPMEEIKGNYVYLGYMNVVLGYGTTTTITGQPDPLLGNISYWRISPIDPLLDSSAKVYTNGGSEIYWSP